MTEIMQKYQDTVEKIDRIPGFTKKHSVEETRSFLEQMGSPEHGMHIVHVAGTNGKGSVCAYLAGILKLAGYHVGLFTSPHLIDTRERFQIDGEPVSCETFLEAFDYVESLLTDPASYYPTYFEMLFFMGMHIFAEAKTDIVILETGVGGRLDATNAVSSKDLTLITKIGLDHTKYLGDTLEKVAGEKAGILMAGVPVIVEGGNEQVADVFEQKAAQTGSPCRILSKKDYGEIIIHKKSIDFSFYSQYYGTVQAKLHTTALYQVDNTALVLAAVESLIERGIVSQERVTKEVLLEGLYRTQWAGRMEEVAPDFFVDGAHNPDGIQAFIKSVAADGCEGKRRLIFSASADKDYPQMLRLLADSGLFECVLLTPMKSTRSLSDEALQEAALQIGEMAAAEVYHNLNEALERMAALKQKNDRVYLAGSLYFVGEAKELILRMSASDGTRRSAVEGR
ncbi:MAG: bifunctional folylpolyglutamate synthase/dihydrofolate synthase [Lachnospiraceae bacterium]|nr:bifunctional folylpolyglutamate synthase/dihydrofolate synthase [Lachnospiraceae bacterium]